MKVPFEIAVGAVYAFVVRDVPAVLWGGGGIGKSSVTKEIVKVLGYGYHETRPYHIKKALRTGNPAEVFPNREKGDKVLWFMDEIVAGKSETEDLQVALYEILLDRKFGEYKLWDGVRIVGASNRKSDEAGVEGFLAPLRTRVGHFEVDASRNLWFAWVFGKNLIEYIVKRVHEYFAKLEEDPDLNEARKKFRIDPRVVMFLNSPQGSEYFYKSTKLNSYGQPAPRSWHLCSKVLFGVNEANLIRAIIGSTVGSGALAVFDAWAEKTGMYDFRRACDEVEKLDIVNRDWESSVDPFTIPWDVYAS